MIVDLVDRNYILWERQAQPRRARARLFAIQEPRLCAISRVDLENARRAADASHDAERPIEQAASRNPSFSRQ